MTESVSTTAESSSSIKNSPKTKLYNLELIKEKAVFYDLALHFGEKRVRLSYNSVAMCCPFHKDDSPSFSFNIQNKFFYCYGCRKSGDIFTYVRHKLGNKSFRETVEFINQFFKIENADSQSETIEKPDFRKKLMAIKKYDKQDGPEFTMYNDQDVANMVLMRGSLFADKGYTQETLDFFQVGFDHKEKRVTVPIRDENGKLVGITGRTLLTKEKMKELGVPKWKHYHNSNVRNYLYNIHNAIKASRDVDGSVILCEGPSDVMMLHQYGYKNTVGCLGNVLTQQKKGLILRNFMTVYIFLDADEGGESGAIDVIEKLKGYVTLFKVNAPENKDPGDMTEEEVKYALKNATKVS